MIERKLWVRKRFEEKTGNIKIDKKKKETNKQTNKQTIRKKQLDKERVEDGRHEEIIYEKTM